MVVTNISVMIYNVLPSFDRKACVFDFSSGNRALVTRSRFDRQTEISETGPARPPSHMNTSKIVQSKKGVRQDLEANNKFMKDFDSSKVSKFIVYLDANSLYPTAMMQPLPVGGFEWLSEGMLKQWEKNR